MSHYRDQLDAALARIETLEAKVKERDAALFARDAELSEMRGEIARLGGEDRQSRLDNLDARGGQRALVVALAVCGLATAMGYAMVRPRHCVRPGSSFRAPAAVRAAAMSPAAIRAADLPPPGIRAAGSLTADDAGDPGARRAPRGAQPIERRTDP